MTEEWFTVPLTRGAVLVNQHTPHALRLGLGLISPCNPRLVRAHHALARLAPVGNAIARRAAPPTQCSRLGEVWPIRSVDTIALAAPRQEGREHFVALVASQDRTVFIKYSTAAESLRKEYQLLCAADGCVGPYRVPQVIDLIETERASALITEALPAGPTLPARTIPAHEHFVDALNTIAERLGWPQPWAHTDYAPWNLRIAAGTTWLVDWTDASGAPSGMDRAYFSVMCASMGWPTTHCEVPEATWDALAALLDHRQDPSEMRRNNQVRSALDQLRSHQH